MTIAALQVGMLAAPVFLTQAPQRTMLENIADLSTIVIGIAVLVLVTLLIAGANEVRQSQRKFAEFIDELQRDLAPTIKNVNDVSTNLAQISDAVTKQVGAVDDTLGMANDRLRSAVDLAYKRVRHFDALLEVAQEEAEGIFFSAASAVRGVKRGAQAITGRDGGGAARRRAREIDLDDSDLDEDDGDRLWDDELEQVMGAPDDDSTHPLTSSEQGPTIHRRRPRTNGPR